ncbi:TadE/TadG family type IV pilus assembly protein [Phenylobacterium deserti]|nr:TadE/TadG family type IV pilus assembly protein [Phenylobacterium deserti]
MRMGQGDMFRRRASRLVSRFGADQRGGTAVTLAISLAVLAPVSLGVLDVYVTSQQKGKLQDALDSATLAAARSPAQTDAEIDQIGDAALAANLALIPGAELIGSTFDLEGNKVISYANVRLPKIGPTPGDGVLRVDSEAQRAGQIEVALVLDNTGSMAGTKLTNLKNAANSLVDKLVDASRRSTNSDPLRISLVPFSSTVRILPTTSLLNPAYNTASHSGSNIPSWIDPQGLAHRTSGSTYDIFDNQSDRLAIMKTWGGSWSGCIESRRAPFDIREDAPNASVPASMFVPYFWPDEPDNGSAASNQINDYLKDNTTNSDWRVKEKRSAKYQKIQSENLGWKNTGTFMSGYSFGPNAGCGLQPMIRLTNDYASVKTAINAMTAVGETNIPLGLMWGWHTLSPNMPLANGKAYETKDLRKIIILMTDGDNTFTTRGENNKSFYHGFGYIWQEMLGIGAGASNTQRTTALNNRLSQLCTNIKNKKIIVYTVRVEVTTGSSTLLQNCASSPDKFYDVQNASGLGAAFDQIAASIQNLRISK